MTTIASEAEERANIKDLEGSAFKRAAKGPPGERERALLQLQEVQQRKEAELAALTTHAEGEGPSGSAWLRPGDQSPGAYGEVARSRQEKPSY